MKYMEYVFKVTTEGLGKVEEMEAALRECDAVVEVVNSNFRVLPNKKADTK